MPPQPHVCCTGASSGTACGSRGKSRGCNRKENSNVMLTEKRPTLHEDEDGWRHKAYHYVKVAAFWTTGDGVRVG